VVNDPRALETSTIGSLCRLRSLRADGLYGRRTGPFPPLADLIVNHLAFAKIVEGHPLDFAVMEEQVLTAVGPFNEAEAAVRNQSLDLTLWHYLPPDKRRRNFTPAGTVAA
jgi:hypothetical protein